MPVIVLAFLLFSIVQASAEELSHLEKFKGIKSVNVSVYDNVSDGCWSSPNTSKTFAEKELLSSGINVKKDADVELSLTAIGFADKIGADNRQIGCTASYNIQVWASVIATPTYSDRRLAMTVELFNSSGVFTSGAKDLSDKLSNKFRELVSAFSVGVMKANLGK
jgi:hypothetical protein